MNLLEMQKQVLDLTKTDQVALGAFINEITRPIDAEFDHHWAVIAVQRMAKLQAGESQGIPLEDAVRDFQNVHR